MLSIHPIDLSIIIILLSLVVLSAFYTRRYNRSVADFLSANRCAGRYLLTIADGIASLGAITIVAMWEQFYQGGFGSIFWSGLYLPLPLLLAFSGWIVYRYRQTRAMTMAQFLEMRYSTRFRIFAGALCFISGVLNYAIFPAVTGRFIIYFLDLPVITGSIFGLDLNLTLGLVMGIGLGAALFISLNGGQIAVMVTDFIQGQLTNVCFLIILAVLLWLIPWSQMVETLKTVPIGESKLNPFNQGELSDFSPWFFVMAMLVNVYAYRVWQGTQGYQVSARSPHEAKMANVLSGFRGIVIGLLVPLSAVAAWVLLNGDAQPESAAAAQATLDGLRLSGEEQLAHQLTTTVALRELLPVGVLGLLTAVMIMAAVSTDSTYLHSWGSIFVQDVYIPIRHVRGKTKLTPAIHMRVLKGAIICVAAFGWFFSMVFPLQEYILMYFQITGAIFTGGAGAVLIGGLYWRKGTTAGAWAAMLTGSFLSVSGVLIINVLWPLGVSALQDMYVNVKWIQDLPPKFWLNGMQAGLAASAISIIAYILFSVLRPGNSVDFERLFHRGKYAARYANEGVPDYVPQITAKAVPWWLRKLGITAECSWGDKLIFLFSYGLFFWQFGIGFIGLTILYFGFGYLSTDDDWAQWWLIFIAVSALVGTIATIWFIIGGFRDLLSMFHRLRLIAPDVADDGSVSESEHFGDSRFD